MAPQYLVWILFNPEKIVLLVGHFAIDQFVGTGDYG
jgi:hypothetical protein